jgi:hypothetical protein
VIPGTAEEQQELREELSTANNVGQQLEVLLVLDRTVMELSMILYNVPRRERRAMRKQNKRLHDAVRKRLLLSKSAAQSQ